MTLRNRCIVTCLAINLIGGFLAGMVRPSQASHVISGGSDDYFVLPTEDAVPGPDLARVFSELSIATQEFDVTPGINGSGDLQVAHTLFDLAGVTAARLQFRIRGGAWPGVENDGVILSFVDQNTTTYCGNPEIVYARTFGPFSGSVCFPGPDPTGLVGFWSSGSETFVELDLGALPLLTGGTLNLLPEIAAKGFLDVTISDETGADFIRVIRDDIITGVDPTQHEATQPMLSISATPNPFMAATQVRIDAAQPGDATIEVFDVAGRVLATIWRGHLTSTAQSFLWEPSNSDGIGMPSGIYFLRVQQGDSQRVRRVVVMR